METQDKKQIMMFQQNVNEHMKDFEQDIKTSPVNAYEDACKARMALNEIINLFLTQGYVED